MTTQTEVQTKLKQDAQYHARVVVIPKQSDICAVCGWPIGTKKAYTQNDGATTHDHPRCRLSYKRQPNQ